MHSKTCLASVVLASIIPATLVQAAPAAGDREIIIQGTGTSDNEFDNNAFSATASYGWFMNDQGLWGIRQSASVVDTPDSSSSWNGGTRLFYDWHFDADAWQPYIGASVGYLYGEDTNETFSAGPELGVKYYVKDKTFIGVSMEYQFLFDDSDEIDDVYDDGAIFYGLGVGYNF